MKMQMSLILLSLLASHAQADTSVVDANGMPLCLLNSAGTEFLKFEWKPDEYLRDVIAERMPRKGMEANTGDRLIDLYQTNCVLQTNPHVATSEFPTTAKIASGDAAVFGYTLDNETQSLLDQVRMGGNLARSETTPEAYLASHPISTFNVDMDRDFTHKFGMGFGAGIYKAFIEQDSTNANFRANLLSYVDQQKEGSGIDIAKRYTDTTIVIVKGYAHTLGGNARYRDMNQDLIDFGLDVKIADTNPFGSNEENRAIILKLLQEVGASGKKIVVIAASKGGIEALGAVSDFNSDQVVGFIGLSAISDGAFIVDWAGSGIKWPILKEVLFKQFNQQGANLTSKSSMDSLLQMSTANTESFFAEHPVARAKSPVFLNLVGTPLGNGLVRDAAVLQVQKQAIEPMLKTAGANDGYVEFPGTEVKRGQGRATYTVAFNSSHAILDGDLEGNSMSDPASRQFVLKAMLSSLRDVLP